MCIFCKIINNEIPSSVVYEDDLFKAILDLSQATKGHTIIITKDHFDNLYETNDKYLENYLLVTKKVMEILKRSFNPKGFNVLSNIGTTAGQSVLHTHIHVIPRYEDNDIEIKFTDNNGVDLSKIQKELKK